MDEMSEEELALLELEDTHMHSLPVHDLDRWVVNQPTNRVWKHTSRHSPDTISWALYRCSLRGYTVSGKPCLETLPCQILQTPSAGNC